MRSYIISEYSHMLNLDYVSREVPNLFAAHCNLWFNNLGAARNIVRSTYPTELKLGIL